MIEPTVLRRRIGKIYLWTLIIGGSYALWVLLGGAQLPCFYLRTTGLLCPGCGISRMFLSLFRLDFSAAFSYNPGVLVLLIFWNGIAALCLLGKPKWVLRQRFLYGIFAATMAILVIYGIARNFY